MARVVGSVNPQTGDTTPPTTPGSVSASAASATTGTVTWTASTDASGVAGYQIFLDGAPLSPTTTNLSYSLTGLSPSTQYAVTVVAFDAAGNNSVAGGPALFTTDANSAPVWALGNQAYETGASVSISLDTVCTDADGDTITYSLVSGSLPSGLALSGARNETLSGTVDTVETAVFTLGASDGIASVQNVALTFTITAPDTVAPAAPTGLTVVSTTSSSINLDWADNAESDLASYDVYRSTVGASGPWGKRNASPLTASNYLDTGLNEVTQYWYYVTATDDSGNESSASAVVTGTTAAASGDLLSGYSIPFAFSYPTTPTNNGDVSVSNQSELNAAFGGGNRILIDTAGSYSLSSMPSNSWVVATVPNVTFSSQPPAWANVIRVEGGGGSTMPPITSTTEADPAEDWYLKNLAITATGAFESGINFSSNNGPKRVVLDQCSVSSADAYGLIGSVMEDLILYRCEFILTTSSTNAPTRIVGSTRVICIQNREVTPTQAARRHCKTGFPSSYYYIEDCQFERSGGTAACLFVEPNNGGGDGAGETFNNIWVINNNAYRLVSDSTGWSFAIGEQNPTNMTNVTVTGNRDYTNNGTPGNTIFGINGLINNLTASDNLIAAATSPPAYAYGAT